MARDTLRDLIGRWRERTGLGIEDLARLLGVGDSLAAPSRQTIYRWISGEQSPEPRRLERLAKVLGVSVGDVALAAEASACRGAKRAKEVS
jgi:transcriptional regulator with XRE-family HTH domain